MADLEPPQASRWRQIYDDNKGIVLVLLAQVVGSSMDAIARFLQLGGGDIHPFQVIFARMSITFVLSSAYMWYTNVPNFPLGKQGVRGLLTLRALFGYFGLWCLYYSVHYLPLAEATVFRFLVPIVTAWACSVFLGTAFTRKELCAGIVALIGVVIIARPSALFGPGIHTLQNSIHTVNYGINPDQRLAAIIISVLGVLGASGAYTMIRVIGDRAHALISVNYFAFVSTVGSTLILLLAPNIGFVTPRGPREWLLLILLGILGFILQFLLTSGLQKDKSSRATSMLYTQILFALLFDWTIWNVLPGTTSIVGGLIVIASTLWSALQKPAPTSPKNTTRSEDINEQTALLHAQVDDLDQVINVRNDSNV